MGKRNQQQLAFYNFLQKRQREKSSFTREEVLDSVGWSLSTFKSYVSKGQVSQFLVEVSENRYEAVGTLDINFVEFTKRLSQSKHYQELGHKCKSSLAKALVKKARDNMMLALELYNRPSLENKLDGFVMLYSAAWEQLLKAILIERDGEEVIFEKFGKKGIKHTIPLRSCLDKVYKGDNDKVKKNILRIVDWRDDAVHLLMPELQGVASRIFQSGVLNFSKKFEEFTEVQFLQSRNSGMISLVGDFKLPPVSVLRSLYGDAADDILELAKTVQDEIELENDMEFAIPIVVSLVYARDSEQGQIILTTANGKTEDLEHLRKALILEKSVDKEKTHPYTETAAVHEVNKVLFEKYLMPKLEKCLVARRNGKPTFNKHCFQAAVKKLNWKSGSNKFHHFQEISGRHIYSRDAVDELIFRITQDDNFLKQAKAKLH